ncbi:MAG: protein-disulfide reductase DsbD family protein [Candidatus Kapaibacterium sp.]
MVFRSLTLIMVIAALFSVNSFAQDMFEANTDNASVKAWPSKQQVSAGEEFSLKVDIEIKGKWYTYGFEEQIGPDGIGPSPTEFYFFPEGKIEKSGDIKAPEPRNKFDEGFQFDVDYYKGSFTVEVAVKALEDIDFSNEKIEASVYMQLCKDEICLPPADYKAVIASETYNPENLEIGAAKKKAGTKDEELKSAADDEEEPSEAGGKNIWVTILISMGAGAAALLTPCVFPLVPITVSFFTQRSEKASSKGLRDAIVYALGIVFTFTALGLVFSLVFGASGIQELTASPWVNLFIVAIFLFFGLSLLGAYEIQIPTSITNNLNRKSQTGTGLSSVILMGLTFSLASFSCTGPLIAAALVSTAEGDWFYPMVSMLSFSAVLAAPFFLLALFPTALKSLPKAGGWMNNVKVVLGMIVLAVTLKYLNNALLNWDAEISRGIFLAFWIGIGLLTTLYILGIFRMSHDTPVEKVSVVRIFFALVFAAFTFYLLSGYTGKQLGELEAFLPEPDQASLVVGGTMTNAADSSPWYDNYEEAVQAAKEENKNIFIDFTGKFCTNCKMMERTVFPLPEVASEMNEMVKVKLITDLRKEPYISNKQFQLEKFKTIAIPFYAILTPEGEVIDTKSYTKNASAFAEFLSKGS